MPWHHPVQALHASAVSQCERYPGMIRVRFGIYNTEEEVDEFLKVLSEALPAAKAFVAEQIEEISGETQALDPSF